MAKITAVLMDVRGIQEYIFSTNKLKLSLAASEIVKDVYEKLLRDAVSETMGKVDLVYDSWKNEPESINIIQGKTDFEVGYIGGGNALLLFRDKEKAKEFIKNWSTSLLIEAPGLRATAIYKDNFEVGPNGEMDTRILYDEMGKTKNAFIPHTVLSKFGITADDTYSGLSAEYKNTEEKSPLYISSVVAAKFHKLDKVSDESYKKYRFPKELDKLGQTCGDDSHIAVVHIDGNSIGKLFSKEHNLIRLRKLSKQVREITRLSFDKLCDYSGKLVDNGFFSAENGFKLDRNTLPLRKVIIGGDDITFVTDGRLGVHFAEKFLEFFTSQKVDLLKKNLTASAGVAIIKTKYPFYRGYKLAEELCDNCKAEAHKEENKGKSYIDFYISNSGLSGSLNDIRERNYTISGGKLLHFGPYTIKENGDRSVSKLKQGIYYFKKNWPRSKIKEFREAIAKDGIAIYEKEIEARKLQLPRIKYERMKSNRWYKEDKESSVYFDMVELMEFYPVQFLKEAEDESH